MNKIVIATRGSALAMWQSEHIKDLIEKIDDELEKENESEQCMSEQLLYEFEGTFKTMIVAENKEEAVETLELMEMSELDEFKIKDVIQYD